MRHKHPIAAFLASLSAVTLIIPTVNAECCTGRTLANARLCNDLTEGTPCCAYGKCNIFCCQCENGCRTDPNVSLIDYLRFRLPCRQGGSRCPWTQWKHDNRPNDGHHDNKRNIHEETEESIKKHNKEDCVDRSFVTADKNSDGVLNITEYLDFMNVDRSELKNKRSVSIWEDYFGSFDVNNQGYVTLADLKKNSTSDSSTSVFKLSDVNSQTAFSDKNGSHTHTESHKDVIVVNTHTKSSESSNEQRNTTKTQNNNTFTSTSTTMRVPFDVPTTLSKKASKTYPICLPWTTALPSNITIPAKVQAEENAYSDCAKISTKKLSTNQVTNYPMESKSEADGGREWTGNEYKTPCWDRYGYPMDCPEPKKLRARGELSEQEVSDAGKDIVVVGPYGKVVARDEHRGEHVWDAIMGTIAGVVGVLSVAAIPTRYKFLGLKEEYGGKDVFKLKNKDMPGTPGNRVGTQIEEPPQFGYGAQLVKPLRYTRVKKPVDNDKIPEPNPLKRIKNAFSKKPEKGKAPAKGNRPVSSEESSREWTHESGDSESTGHFSYKSDHRFDDKLKDNEVEHWLDKTHKKTYGSGEGPIIKSKAKEKGKGPAHEAENLRGNAPFRYPGEDLRYKGKGKAPAEAGEASTSKGKGPARDSSSEDTTIWHRPVSVAESAKGREHSLEEEKGAAHDHKKPTVESTSDESEIKAPAQDKGKGKALNQDNGKAPATQKSSSEEEVYLRPPPARLGREGESSGTQRQPAQGKGKEPAKDAKKSHAKEPAQEKAKESTQDAGKAAKKEEKASKEKAPAQEKGKQPAKPAPQTGNNAPKPAAKNKGTSPKDTLNVHPNPSKQFKPPADAVDLQGKPLYKEKGNNERRVRFKEGAEGVKDVKKDETENGDESAKGLKSDGGDGMYVVRPKGGEGAKGT